MIVLSTKEEATTKAKAFALGANDYLVKLPDRIELLARIRYHSKGYINLLERNEAYRALAESQQRLADEIDSAAKYVQSLLPAKIQDGPVRDRLAIHSVHRPVGRYVRLSLARRTTFCFYLIDVVGHGVAAALLSVSVLNAIRSQSLPGVDFHNPGQVVTALNQRFQMSQQSEKYFTGWYGVYDVQSRRITYAGGGHPPVFLMTGETAEAAELKMLESTGPMIGAIDGLEFDCESIDVGHYGRLFLYSDGVYEVHLPGGDTWTFAEFKTFMGQQQPDDPAMDRLRQHTLTLSEQDHWDDDFSIIELRF